MKATSTLLSFLIVLTSSITLTSQIDLVSMGNGYVLQSYYSLSTGDVYSVPNDAWDIAFSATGEKDGGILINESVGFVGQPVRLFLAPTSVWEDVITDKEIFVDSVRLHNADTSWTEGAFNNDRDITNNNDFGWGVYNPSTDAIEGNKIYVVKQRDDSFKKLQIVQLRKGAFTFKYADLDGANEREVVLSSDNVEGSLLYYSIKDDEQIEIPADYDLVFQRYSTPIVDTNNDTVNYNVSGVFLGPGVEAVVARDVDPLQVSESDYADQYSSDISTIGFDWKFYDFQSGWVVDDRRTEFVKNAKGNIYQVTFYNFEGTSTGTTTLGRELLFSVSTEDLNDEENLTIYPNPTQDYFIIDSEDDYNLSITMFDNLGRLVKSVKSKSKEEVFVNDCSSGFYTVVIQSDKGAQVERLIVR